MTAWAWRVRTCCLFVDFWVCLHLSAFGCGLSTWGGPDGCAVSGGYAPLEVARQWEVATDFTFSFFSFLIFLTVLIFSVVFIL